MDLYTTEFQGINNYCLLKVKFDLATCLVSYEYYVILLTCMIDMINCNLYVLPGLVMFTNPIVNDFVATLHKGIGECDKL